jgi:hypothetical protein
MTDTNPAYLLSDSVYGLISLRFWCDGTELCEAGVPFEFASRFTRSSAYARKERAIEEHGVDLDVIYLPALEPNQLALPCFSQDLPSSSQDLPMRFEGAWEVT